MEVRRNLWSDVGLPQLYGSVIRGHHRPGQVQLRQYVRRAVGQHPLRRLRGGRRQPAGDRCPGCQALFQKLGYMESSSSDLFDQFLKTGMGAKPLIAGYESQLLEFAVQDPETWEQIKGDIVMVYPTPTVWSSHVYHRPG